ERALERGDDLGRIVHVFAVKTDRLGHRGHARLAVIGDLPRVGVVAGAPEARAIAGVAAVVDVQRGDPDAVACDGFEIAHHVADAGVAGDVHALAIGIGELGGDGAGQAEAQGRDVPPAEEPARDLRLVHRARLITRVAAIRGDERVLRIEHLHEVAVHAIRIDRRTVRFQPWPELREKLLRGRADLVDEGRVLLRRAG